MGLEYGGGYAGGRDVAGGGYEPGRSKKSEDFQKWLAEEIARQQVKKKKRPAFELEETKRKEKKSLRRRLGRPTLLTSPLGLTGEAPTRRATLLGG